MLENTKNSTCNFEEQIVSYLYDEMNVADKSHFETHLGNCSSCQDEIADFSMVRSSIQEWKDEEFLPLQNPAIEIPYPAKVGTISRSWFLVIRDFFTLSPAWVTASTALAALAICIGLFAVVVSSLQDDRSIAGIEKGNANIFLSPTDGNQNQNKNVSNSNSNQNTQKPVNSSEPLNSERGQKSIVTKVEPTKISGKQNAAAPQNLPIKTVQPRSNGRKSDPLRVKTQRQKAPSFFDDDEEEDSLTLTDLLEEIGKRDSDD